MYDVAVIVGSLRKDSYNKKLANALSHLNHPQLNLKLIKIDDIPLYNQDLDKNVPSSVERLKKEISNSAAILFVTPEYNRSIPGVLKNIIDWGTRPPGQNSWSNKIIAMAGTSQSAVSTAVAQSHLRSIMPAINATVIAQSEVYLNYKDGLIDDDFNITVKETREFLQTFLDGLAKKIESNCN